MLKIALAGSIASGKSTVEAILRDKGYDVYDTDKIVHEILDSSQEVMRQFSEFDILTNGKIDRKKLGNIVFSDTKLLRELEDIIHPKVKEEILKIFEEKKDVVFISVPQLYESGFDRMFDKVIFVTADEKVRLERLMQRNSISSEEALIRIKAQKDEEEKIKKSDYVLKNNSDLDALRENLDSILNNILL